MTDMENLLLNKKSIDEHDIDNFEDVYSKIGLVLPRFQTEELMELWTEIDSHALDSGWLDEGCHLVRGCLERGYNTWWGYLLELRKVISGRGNVDAAYLFPFILPLDELPLYINEPKAVVRHIVNWRLRLGR
jgi:hypothetical protein